MKSEKNKRTRVITDEQYDEKMPVILGELSSARKSGFFKGFDGTELFYEYYLSAEDRGTVVIVHGLSEFTAKFYEFAYYLINEGYNVFTYDQRCHGRSQRLTDSENLIHVGDFNHYVSDLRTFIDEIVCAETEGKIYLFGHSMGGAVVALYMAEENCKAYSAVLSSPMIVPHTGGVNSLTVKMYVRWMMATKGRKSRFKFSSDFNPDAPFITSSDTSKKRFEYNMKLRREVPQYRTSAITVGWIYQALQVKKKLVDGKLAAKITAPVLLLSAEKDTVVKNHVQTLFAKECPNCRMHCVKGAKHSLLGAESDILERVIAQVLDFFEE